MRTVNLRTYFNECIDRFGHDRNDWKFVCPSCGHVASVAEYKAAGAENAIGYSCIGRWTGATQKAFAKGTGPCDYAGGGLIGINPVRVVSEDGGINMFELAPADEWVKPGDLVTWTRVSHRGSTMSMTTRSGIVLGIKDYVATVQSHTEKKAALVQLHDLRLSGQKTQLTELVEAVAEASRE